jgi:hypothetical protein
MSLRARIREMHAALEGMFQLQLDHFIHELLREPKYQEAKRLSRFEHKVFSQGGEDGIIAEIFRRIGTETKVFVECAPGDGLENNTAYLLVQGWKGLWIEADPKHVRAIKANFARQLDTGSLVLQPELATAENIESIIARRAIPPEFDLLSIDIDGNDYWLWEAIRRYRPRAVVIEYNATFPPDCKWVFPYLPQARWDGTSNQGASLASLESLGAEKGYVLVGCSLEGTNAFFVRHDLVQSRFCEPFTAENHYEPPRYYLTARRAGHRRSLG